jgi:hypothetical protein
MTSYGIEPATLRLVAKCLNQLRYLVPEPLYKHANKELALNNVIIY